MQAIHSSGESVGGGVRTFHDGRGPYVEGEEKRKVRVWGLRKGGVGRVTGLTPHVPEWEGKGKALDMDRRGYGGGEGGEPQTYQIEFPKGGTKACPVEGFPGRAGTRTAMWVHFWRRHVRGIMIILEEGNLPHPRCPQCDMLVLWRALNGRHKNTEMCRSGAENKRRRMAEAEARDSAEMAFEVYRAVVDSTSVQISEEDLDGGGQRLAGVGGKPGQGQEELG